MSDVLGFVVWLQGGPGDDVRVVVLSEPPDTIVYMPDSPSPVKYIRVPEVEQFEHERIYYPLGEAA